LYSKDFALFLYELNHLRTIDKVNFDYVGEDKYLHRMVLFKCGLIKTPLLKKALRAMKQIPLSDKEYVFLFFISISSLSLVFLQQFRISFMLFGCEFSIGALRGQMVASQATFS